MRTEFILGGLVLLFAVVCGASILSPSRSVKKKIAGRKEIDVEVAIAERFSATEYDLTLAHDIWRAIAHEYHVSPGLLRLGDRFEVELNPRRTMSIDDEVAGIDLMMSGLAKDRGIDLTDRDLETIEDCIAVLCAIRPACR